MTGPAARGSAVLSPVLDNEGYVKSGERAGPDAQLRADQPATQAFRPHRGVASSWEQLYFPRRDAAQKSHRATDPKSRLETTGDSMPLGALE